jgi:hypothetical protein
VATYWPRPAGRPCGDARRSARRHGHLAGGHDLPAVGRVDVALQVGVAGVGAHARHLLPHPAAARRGRRGVPDDGARAGCQLRRVARRRRLRRTGAQQQCRGDDRQHQLLRRFHGFLPTTGGPIKCATRNRQEGAYLDVVQAFGERPVPFIGSRRVATSRSLLVQYKCATHTDGAVY